MIHRVSYWGGGPSDSFATVTAQSTPVESLRSLGQFEQSILLVGMTVLIGVVVLGLLPEYGRRTLETTRQSPIISICIGVPGTLVLATLVFLGLLIGDSSIGVFFAIPMVSLGSTILAGWTAIGFVAIGAFLSGRVGLNQTWLTILLGGVCSGLAAFSLPVGVVVFGLAASLGTGAGARVVLNGGGFTSSTERVVPPANKV